MSREASARIIVGLVGIVLSGGLMVLPFPPFNQEWVTWWMMVPALLAVHACPFWRRHPFLGGYLMGVLAFGGQLWWIGHVTVPGMMVLVAYLALYPSLWLGGVVWWGVRRVSLNVGANLALAAAAAGWWVVLDWLRGWLLTGFPWNNLGVGLWQNAPLVQLAWLGGLPLLAWLIVFANVCLARMLLRVRDDIRERRRRQPFWEGGVALMLVAAGFAWGLSRTLDADDARPHHLRVAAVQPNIPQSAYQAAMTHFEIMSRHARLSSQAAVEQPDLLVWPEATSGMDPDIHVILRRVVEQITRDLDIPLLFGAQHAEVTKSYNAAFLWPPGGEAVDIYRKNHLVIFGEYVPLAGLFPFLKNLVPAGVDFSPGDKPALFTLPATDARGPVTIAPLICFEDTLPHVVRRAAAPRPDLLIDLTNDNWFGESPGAEQHLANAVFRAAEQGIPLIRAANSGVSCVVDQRGRVREAIADKKDWRRRVGIDGFMVSDVAWRREDPGPYARYGDWVVALAGLGCVLWLLALRRWTA